MVSTNKKYCSICGRKTTEPVICLKCEIDIREEIEIMEQLAAEYLEGKGAPGGI